MASSQESTAVWFAPAGFNRGGLSNGSSGLNVLDVRERLSLKQRDALYEVNVNPIASFPSEGIVIFGQKTLQATPSALDRINVRRLAIYLKDRIGKISKGILFDPNLQVTWDRFLSQVNPLMADTKARFGLSDYKVVLDNTTTTPDLIDRNIMYAKVYIKPARAIEFIAIDFIITNTGASFDE
jgi:phage tail sheath protein FI